MRNNFFRKISPKIITNNECLILSAFFLQMNKSKYHAKRIFFNVPKKWTSKRVRAKYSWKAAVQAAYTQMWNAKIDVPLYIGSEEIRTENTKKHDSASRSYIVGTYHPCWKITYRKPLQMH
jgi:hypothetical protein